MRQPHSGGSETKMPPLQMNGSPFEIGLLWGRQQAQMDRHTILLERIATGMDSMPDRLSERLLQQRRRFAPLRTWAGVVRVVIPSVTLWGLVATRLLAPQAFFDVVAAIKAIVTHLT